MATSVWAAATLAGVPGHAAETPADLIDVTSRIDYGFYAADRRTLEAAHAALIRRSAPRPADVYYRAYAAYRLSQLGAGAAPVSRRERIGECLTAARAAAEDPGWAIEAWILVAACALEGRTQDTARTLAYEIRLTEALRAARELAPSHPRLLLVEAWAAHGPDDRDPAAATAQIALLEQVRLRFESWKGNGAGYDWGRPELLTHLAAAHLAGERRREARDLIEQALIEAPDYHIALALQKTVLLRH